MTPATPAAQPGIAAIGRAIVPLLAIAVFINYVDCGNLAIAAPLIKDQLHLFSTQIGLLLSAFFWIQRDDPTASRRKLDRSRTGQ